MTYMRLTTKLVNESVINSLNINKSKLNELNEQLSTGTRVDKPSDDPGAAVSILSASTSLDKIDRYLSNIETATSELDVADDAIAQITDIIGRAKELATEASNATTGSTALEAINNEITQLIQSVKDIANTEFNGKYIFGGQITDTPPYSEDENGDIIYNGTPSTGDYARKMEISENVSVTVNVTGDSIFGQYVDSDPTKQTGLIGTLMKLSNNLTATTTDYDAISASLDEFDANLNDFLSAQTVVGGVESRLDMTQNKLENDSLTFKQFRSDAENVDLSQVISDIAYQETALQASLKVGAQIAQYTIMDYL